MTTLHKVKAGRYETVKDGTHYEVRIHDGLTWQDPDYWTIYRHGEPVTRVNSKLRRFRTLRDVRAFIDTDPLTCTRCGDTDRVELCDDELLCAGCQLQ